MSRYFWLLIIGVCFSITAAGCNLPGTVAETPVQMESTQAALTVEARLTELPAAGVAEPAAGTSSASAGLPTPGAGQSLTVTVAPTLTRVASPTTTIAPSATPGLAPSATQTFAPTPTEILEELFSDDFSTESGWYTSDGENYGFEFTKGGYQIYVNIAKAHIWSIRDVEYEDVILETDAARTAGPLDGYYGLVCRHVDSNNYYALFISSDGYYGIGKMVDGEFEYLVEGADNSGAIKSGAAFNKLRADCIGDALRLYSNGIKLAEIKDDSFESGVGGLIASTRLETGLEVLFDNYAVYQLQP